MPLTPEHELQDEIVWTLGEMGGSGTRAQVLDAMADRLATSFTVEDQAPVETRPWETRWRNRSSYARSHMQGGLLTRRRDGVWELSAEGWVKYSELHGHASPAGDPLAHFKPGDSSAYTVKLKATTQTKERRHEDLIQRYGLWIETQGFVPSTAVYPQDLTLEKAGKVWLVEAKVVYNEDATTAVRACVGQLFEYRFFLHEASAQPAMVALLSEPVGSAYVDYLSSLDIYPVWDAGGVWKGSVQALGAGLAER